MRDKSTIRFGHLSVKILENDATYEVEYRYGYDIQKQLDDMHEQLKAIITTIKNFEAMKIGLNLMKLINVFYFEILICLFITRIISMR